MIDTTKPGKYSLIIKGARPEDIEILNIFDVRGRYPSQVHRYAVVYTENDCAPCLGWYNEEDVIDKPKWEPEVRKLYFFSEVKENVNTWHGHAGILVSIDTKRYDCYRTNDNYNWKYCWPIPDDVEIGK